MRIIKYYFILIFLVMSILPVLSQNECSDVTLTEARKKYETGNFNQVITLLSDCIHKGFSGPQQAEAYRLLSLTYLAMDSVSTSSKLAEDLLKINPNFEPDIFDLPRFINLINRLKQASLSEQVTSVSKKAESIYEAPANIIVITREEIEQRGYMDLVELLKDVPGFDITLFYGSQLANIYQRGFRQNSTEKTLMLIDGIEDNDLWTNWTDISRQYPLSNIERVEIIYGPASTMYGPNAFAGVINVITQNENSFFSGEKKWGLKANAGYGTYNTRCLDLSLAGRAKKFSFSLTGRIYASDGMDLSSQTYFDYNPDAYDSVDYISLLSIKKNAREYLIDNHLAASNPFYIVSPDTSEIILTEEGNNAACAFDKSAYDQVVNGNKIGFTDHAKSWFLNGKMRFGKFSFGFQTWKMSQGSTTQYTDLYVPGSENGFVWVPQLSFVYAKYEDQVSDKLFISSLTNYRIHALTEDSRFVSLSNYARGNKDLADLVNGIEPEWITQYAFEISKQLRTELKFIYTPLTKLDIVTGIEVRNSSLQGGYLFSTDSHPQDSAVVLPSPMGGNQFNVWDLGIYAQGTYELLKNLKLTLGARYDYDRIRSSGGFGSEISPRAALVYSPKNFVFKAIYSRGIENVSNWTKFSMAGNRIPNPNLRTESIQNYEFTATWMPNKELYFDIAIYHSNIYDVVGTIAVPEQPGKNQNANIGTFKINGIQASASYKTNYFTAYLNYTFTDPRQTYNETGPVDNRVGDIAGHKFNAGINKVFFEKLNINLRMNYVSERKTGPGTTVPLNYDKFPAVTVFNGAISYSDILPGLKLEFVCNNIFNKTYFHPGTKAADGALNPTSILQRGRHFVIRILYAL
ncbi:MAG: TonB-dependent receptor [Bacteroidetes bacterium]|nr:TonB-dependent receptor [Bacteroidota bacterium]